MKKKIQKPFDAEAAKNGAIIETKNGRSVRILCYDKVSDNYPIVALVKSEGRESCHSYTLNGEAFASNSSESNLVIIEEVDVPKFNVGNWLVAYNEDLPRLITAVTSDCYELEDVNGHKVSICHRTIENLCILWTLKDAKPGDVLISEDDKHPFIFKKFLGYFPSAYCGIDTTDSIYISDADRPWTRDTVRPATYEERQLLFNKLEAEGYKWNAESLTLTKIQKKWKDNEKNTISGYYTHSNSRITYSKDHNNTKENYNIFATEKQAKSALALAQISQIMANDERFGGVVTDEEWCNNVPSYYVILKVRNILVITTSYRYEYLGFHTMEQANLFLEENEDLVKDYYMMD